MIKLTYFVVILLALSVAAAAFISAGSYDLNLALDAVGYSNVAYCSRDQVAQWTCPNCAQFPGVTDVLTAQVELKASTAWAGYDAPKNRIVVAFRGTVDIQGWIEDFDFFQTQYDPASGCGPDCKVHEGLYWGYTELMTTLFPHVQQLVAKHPTADIVCAGHSMGAAQAGMCLPAMITRFGNITKGKIRAYIFGEPRIGNPAFVKWQQTVLDESESFRVTNYGDPVVHLPPVVFDELHLGNWIHNPREIFYQNNFGSPSDYKVCAGNYTYEDPTCADSTPIWAMSMSRHTTYLNIGMGC